LTVFAGGHAEDKRKRQEENLCVSTRGSLRRFRIGALKHDSMRANAVIAKSSREGNDTDSRDDRAERIVRDGVD
jgi:hypothetical protein